MNHRDRINLLKGGVQEERGVWAEFGSGIGAFTLALAELIEHNSTIFSVDRDSKALKRQEQEMKDRFPDLEVHYLTADFFKPLDLPQLDGILMANALHFVKEKEPFILRVRDYLKRKGALLIVEYNIDDGNPWVPHPISFSSWEALATQCGFAEIRLLNTKPSRYHKEIYCAVAANHEPEKQ